jgi:hypothetical protein
MHDSQGMEISIYNTVDYNSSLNIRKISLRVYDFLRTDVNKR